MDTSKLAKELGIEVDNLVGISDDTSDEYKKAINNVHKLSQVVSQQEDLNLKREKNSDDDKYRNSQLNFEKRKWKEELLEREKDRVEREKDRQLNREKLDLERDKMDFQHAERMEELKIEHIKAENEKTILEQQKKKSSKEFWLNVLGKVGLTIIKVGGTALIVYANVKLHANEIYLERKDNAIIPNRCKVYSSNMDRLAEGFLK